MNEAVSKAIALFKARGGRWWHFPILIPFWKAGVGIPPFPFLKPIYNFLIVFIYFWIGMSVLFYLGFDRSMHEFWSETVPYCAIGGIFAGMWFAWHCKRKRLKMGLPTWDEFKRQIS